MNYVDAETELAHRKARDYEQLAIWSSFYKFSVVRNPWEKEVSDYKFQQTLPWTKVRNEQLSFPEYLQLEEFTNDTFGWHSPQLGWLTLQDGTMGMDKVIRYSNLRAGFSELLRIIGIEQQELGKHNVGVPRGHYSTFYDDETKLVVAERYAPDIEYWGFEFEDRR